MICPSYLFQPSPAPYLELSRYFWSTFRNAQISAPYKIMSRCSVLLVCRYMCCVEGLGLELVYFVWILLLSAYRTYQTQVKRACVENIYLFMVCLTMPSVSHIIECWLMSWSRHLPSETEETHDKHVSLVDTWTRIYIGHLLNTSLEQCQYPILLIYMKQNGRFRI